MNLCSMQKINKANLNSTTRHLSLSWNHVFYVSFVYHLKISLVWHQSINYLNQGITNVSNNAHSLISFLRVNSNDMFTLTLSSINVFSQWYTYCCNDNDLKSTIWFLQLRDKLSLLPVLEGRDKQCFVIHSSALFYYYFFFWRHYLKFDMFKLL